MSAHMMHEQVCYIHCNFCNTTLADETYGQLDQALLAAERPGPHRPSQFLFEKILRAIQVSIPGNMFNIVTVRCGRCSCLLSVNLGALAQAFPLQIHNFGSQSERFDLGSSKYSRNSLMYSMKDDQHKKRQRVPSAYNRFIREEIQRIKANNPDINHKEAFSAAAKNWAHFPHIHFGLSLDGNNKQVKLDEGIGAAGGGKGQGIF